MSHILVLIRTTDTVKKTKRGGGGVIVSLEKYQWFEYQSMRGKNVIDYQNTQ